nr:hypothetical protein [Actinoplanes sp. L3-i22]
MTAVQVAELTSAGAFWVPPVTPAPSWPLVLSPQQYRASVASWMPQAKVPPAATALHVVAPWDTAGLCAA